MDGSDQGAGRLVPLSTLGVMFAALISAWWPRSDLDTQRHPEPATFERTVDGHESTSARLWQDPILVAHQAREATVSSFWGPSTDHRLTRNGLERSMVLDTVRPYLGVLDEPAKPALTLLTVLVNGQPGSEASETRRRRRHAVLSGLGVQGYVPVASDHLGIFYADDVFPRRRFATNGEEGFTDKPVAFEWFRRDELLQPADARGPFVDVMPPGTGSERVLVMWLDEAYLGSRPLWAIESFHSALLANLARYLDGEIGDRHIPAPPVADDVAAVMPGWERALWPRVDLRVLGPSGSTTLLNMMQELSLPPVEPPLLAPEVRRLVDVANYFLDSGLPQQELSAEQVRRLDDVLAEVGADTRGFAFRHGAEIPEELKKQLHVRLRAGEPNLDIESLDEALRAWFDDWVDMLHWNGDLHSDNEPAQLLTSRLIEFSFVKESDRRAFSKYVRSLIARDANVRERRVQLGRVADELGSIFTEIVDSSSSWAPGVAVAWDAGQALDSRGGVDGGTHIERSRLAPRILIINSRATVPWRLAAQAGDIARWCEANGDIKRLFSQTGRPQLISAVAQDHHLALALVQELERRGVDLEAVDGTADHVALLSEWDTLYGRSLAAIIEAAVRYVANYRGSWRETEQRYVCRVDGDTWPVCWSEHLVECLQPSGPNPEEDAARRVHRVSYLRGLDGHLPGDVAGTDDADPTNAGHLPSQGPYELLGLQGLTEIAAGRNQLDQVRRVADQLRHTDRILADDRDHDVGEGRVRAIGVLGSDFYDKQLMLDALKPDFPHAVFFTSDLDARFLHHDAFPSNRNLIVASSFGLELSPGHQLAVAPFRHAYQTAEFVATRVAIARRPRDTILWTRVQDSLTQPRLFEIGRQGVVDITPSQRGGSSALHPARRHLAPHWSTVWRVVLLLGLTALLVISLSRHVRRNMRRDWIAASMFAASFVLTVLVVVWFIGRDTGAGDGEPFALSEGVSIWPTEMIRLIVAFVSSASLFISIRSLQRSEERLADAYGLGEHARRRAHTRGARWMHAGLGAQGLFAIPERLRRLRRRRKSVSISAWTAIVDGRSRGPDERVDTATAWARYLYLGRPGHRFVRLLPLVATFVLIGLLLTAVLGKPHVPFRGARAELFDRLALIASVSAITVLVFFVVDATRLCAQLVRTLASARSTWKLTGRVERVARERGLRLEDLSEYLDIEFIAERTEVVGRLIVCPFVALLLMIVSRHQVFDAWDWPPSLVIIFASMAAAAVASGVGLRSVAEKARGKALTHMRRKLSKLQTPSQETRRARFEMLIEDVASMRRGAFAPFAGSPVLSAVLIPFGGVSTLTLIETLTQS
jgi:hypothetical protein